MKKITRIYSTEEVLRAFRVDERMKKEGYTGTMSFVRGKRTSDLRVKIEYVKIKTTKHKHKWQFFEKIGVSFIPGERIDGSEIKPGAFAEGHWTKPRYLFVCECGVIKMVKEKIK